MEIRKIEKEDILDVQKISSLAFQWSLDVESEETQKKLNDVTEAPKDKWSACWQNHWAAFNDNGQMVSTVSLMDYEVYFDGTLLSMKGVGNVCTYPQYRRKGSIREIFRNSLSEMYENNIAFSYLYPFSENFYGKFGYYRSCRKRKWSFDLNTIPEFTYPGCFTLYQGEQDLPEFDNAYIKYAKKHNMMVKRDGLDWNNLKTADPFKTDTQAYLYKDENGSPSGYFIFSRLMNGNDSIINCNEMVFDSFDTLKAIMSFIKSLSSHYQLVQFYAPDTISLEYFCKDYPQSRCSQSVETNGMVRVVNAKVVLMNAAYKGDGQIRIKLFDEFLPSNSKTYEVIFKDNRAETVTEDYNDADIEMRVNEFSAAILGNFSVEDFEYLDHIKLNCSKNKAEKVFYRKPCFITNFF